MRFFLLDLTLRESCFECLYRKHSLADLRIGDYWGSRYKTDKTGVSMVAAMTETGSRLVNALSEMEDVLCVSHPVSDYTEGQPAYKSPRVPAERAAVLADLNNPRLDMAALYRKWIAPRRRVQKLRRFYGRVRYHLRKVIRRRRK